MPLMHNGPFPRENAGREGSAPSAATLAADPAGESPAMTVIDHRDVSCRRSWRPCRAAHDDRGLVRIAYWSCLMIQLPE
jgi:hypothetical protein